MAIIQYILERHAGAVGWPASERARALAQSISAEMHSGFLAVRDELPQNIRARRKRDLADLSEACINQIERIDQIWSECRREYGDQGEWLFGAFSLADIMFAPVALRFVTYQIPISDPAAEFQHTVGDLPTVRDWIAAAREEPETIPFVDANVPAANSPLTLG
jgi:glutathione S-transferase